jgi:hypothetical protein
MNLQKIIQTHAAGVLKFRSPALNNINQKVTVSIRMLSIETKDTSEAVRENIFFLYSKKIHFGPPRGPSNIFNNFYEGYKTLPSYTGEIPSPKFLSWFIGFSEADGGWFLKDNSKLFVIRQKDPNPLHYIYQNLGFGHVSLDSDGYYSYRVYKQEYAKILTLLFKGNTYLSRNINKWKYIIGDSELNSFVPTLNDNWLSGFTQGDGGFNINITKRENTKLGYRIRLRYYLDQKESETELLFIKSLLKGGVVNKRSGENMYRYTLDSNENLLKVAEYMKNNLVGEKSRIFEKWAEALKVIETKNHLTKEGFEKIRKLKEEMEEIRIKI